MNDALEHMWQKLVSYQIVAGPRPGMTTDHSPWYIKLLLALSGWVAAFLLVGFIGSVFGFVMQNAAFSFVLGIAFIAAAYCLLARQDNEFLAHLALAVSLAGQALLMWGVVDALHESVQLCALILAIIEVVLTMIMPSFIHRVFSSFAAACAFYVGVAITGANGYYISAVAEGIIVGILALAMSWLWLHEFRFPHYFKALNAIAYGITLALVIIKMTSVFGIFNSMRLTDETTLSANLSPWLGQLLLVAVLVWVVARIVGRLKYAPIRVLQAAIVGALVVGVCSVKAPGIVIGILMLLLGHHARNTLLTALGIAALIGFISRYYYFLEHTLAVKAGILLALGITLLMLRYVLIRVSTANDTHMGAAQ